MFRSASALLKTMAQLLNAGKHELTHVYQQRSLGWDDVRLGIEQRIADSDYCYGPLVSGKSY